MKHRLMTPLALLSVLPLCAAEEKLNISGVYPELAYYNREGECGTGAVVPWAGKLWVITYGPHKPFGSSDKLYEISPDLQLTVRPESVGGTPANRMIHNETQQLFIGPYLIDAAGKVRVLSPEKVPGRHTGSARHLTDPANKMLLATMEEGFYEIDLKTLEAQTLFADGNVLHLEKKIKSSTGNPLLPGAHGKGLYSGQGVMVFSNNGDPAHRALSQFDAESGVLAEYDGKNWNVVRRNQFTEITGPGGIHGNRDAANDPIWAVGWDHRSLLLAVRENKAWRFYRLPKASNSYDGAHGWNTEWPRIRDIGADGKPEYMMTMHGMFWSFPNRFGKDRSAGIRPLSNYLKVIGDFTRWNDRVVLGCDDSANKEFLNVRKCKGKIAGAGQSHSNLWFVNPDALNQFGPTYANGYLYKQESVAAQTTSEPFLFAGWPHRTVWVANHGKDNVTLQFETDKQGNDNWGPSFSVALKGGESRFVAVDSKLPGEWIRVKNDRPANMTVALNYAPDEKRGTTPDPIFGTLATTDRPDRANGLLYARGNDARTLALMTGKPGEARSLYSFDAQLNARPLTDAKLQKMMLDQMEIPVFSGKTLPIESVANAVRILDDKKRPWLLPVSDRNALAQLKGDMRLCREVSTERDLFHCGGTFFELPAENADGFAKIRPIASHPFAIHDYASYRGLLVMTGVKPGVPADRRHVFGSADGKAMVWAGVIDDLWKLGKPTGKGGPWLNADVKANSPSEPYLFGGYDVRELKLSHRQQAPVRFTVEIDPAGEGVWHRYQEFEVAPGQAVSHLFPRGIQGRWIRFTADRDCNATAALEYR